jgi:amidase
VFLKATIDTADDMPTHAGSLALKARYALADAGLVQRLRAAGAVILGKTNLSEWANFRSANSLSGWSSVGGQTHNPHVLDRNSCGSSSGSALAVAAGLVPIAIGTETNGSIVCPAGLNGVVGYKPSFGRISTVGVIPVAAESFDTIGPFARSVRDAAIATEAMLIEPDALTAGFSADALAGKRIGIWRGHFGAEQDPRLSEILRTVIQALADAGAVIVDPVDYEIPKGVSAATYRVMLHEFKLGVDVYLRGPTRIADYAGPESLADVIAFNQAHAKTLMPWFGQDILQLAEAQGELSEREYAKAVRASRDRLRRSAAKLFRRHKLAAFVALTNAPAWPNDSVMGDRFTLSSSTLAAISGMPALSLPAGAVRGLPVGVTLMGQPLQDAELLALGDALERHLPPPVRPLFLRTLEP